MRIFFRPRPRVSSSSFSPRLSTFLLSFSHFLSRSSAFSPCSPPLYQTATFTLSPSALRRRPKAFPASFPSPPSSSYVYDYSRSGNPTRHSLESQLAAIEVFPHKTPCFARCFVSGLAALQVCLDLLTPGTEIAAGLDLYGGSFRLLEENQGKNPVNFVDFCSSEAVENLFSSNPRIRLVLLEIPSNPLMISVDLARLAERIKNLQPACLIVVDNSLLSAFLHQPLVISPWVDIALQSTTKFLNGHSDSTGGVLTTRNSRLAERISFLTNAKGIALPPFECWLILRGLKTLSIRISHQQRSCQEIIRGLAENREKLGISRLRHAGGNENPIGALFTMEIHRPAHFSTDSEFLLRFTGFLRLFRLSVSFGGVNSSVNIPAMMSHRKSRVRPPMGTVRFSIGIEDTQDLMEDIQNALRKIQTRPKTRRK